MDLKGLDVVSVSEHGIEVPIVNPKTGETTDIVITAKGMHSKQFRELIGRAAKRVGKNGGMTGDDELMADTIAAITLGWVNMEEDGQKVPFSREAAARIYAAYPVIRKQVFDAVTNEGNLIPD